MSEEPVLVVGAGPVGLTAALALRAQGRPVTVLEAEPAGRRRPGSRAIFTHHATLTLLEEVSPGLGHRLAADGVVWPTKRTFWRGREVYVRHYPPSRPGELPPFTSLPQVDVERHLLAAAEAAGVEIVWEAPVAAVESTADGVTLRGAGRSWSAGQVVAADGSRSAVRRALGIAMEGEATSHDYVVVDVREDPADPLPPARTFHYEHPAVGRRNVLLVPFAGGWRVDLQLHDGDDPAVLGGEPGVQAWLCRVMPPRYAERVGWVSTYRFLQLVAERFVDEHRRVLLVGEAAHLFAPFGARGLNSGVADAVAAARAVTHGTVDAFAADRRAAALRNRDAAGLALRHIQARDPVMRLRRAAAGLAARWSPRAGYWLDSGPYGPRSGATATSKY